LTDIRTSTIHLYTYSSERKFTYTKCLTFSKLILYDAAEGMSCANMPICSSMKTWWQRNKKIDDEVESAVRFLPHEQPVRRSNIRRIVQPAALRVQPWEHPQMQDPHCSARNGVTVPVTLSAHISSRVANTELKSNPCNSWRDSAMSNHRSQCTLLCDYDTRCSWRQVPSSLRSGTF